MSKKKSKSKPQPRPRRFYISGPMRGKSNLNFPAFDAARDALQAMGYDPISPADMDREHNISEAVYNLDDVKDFVRRDTNVLLALDAKQRDGVVVLAGWEASTGALAEVCVALWLGLPVYRLIDGQLKRHTKIEPEVCLIISRNMSENLLNPRGSE